MIALAEHCRKAGFGQYRRARIDKLAARIGAFAAYVLRQCTRQRHIAARYDEVLQHLDCACAHGEQAAHKHLTVARRAYAQEHFIAVALDTRVAHQRLLVGIVEVQPRAHQFIKHVGIALFQRQLILALCEYPLGPAYARQMGLITSVSQIASPSPIIRPKRAK